MSEQNIQGVTYITMKIPESAPKTIDEIGNRTFVVKERLWAWNTVANLKLMWCKTHFAYPQHYIAEIKQLETRLLQLVKCKEDNKHEISTEQTDKDIESIRSQLDKFKTEQCSECVSKYNSKIDNIITDTGGPTIALGSGPSVLKRDGEGWRLRPKALEQLKLVSWPIFCCDRSLIPCLKEGIIPKYVLAADGADHVIEYFKGDLVKQHAPQVTAIFNTQIHPDVAKLWVENNGKIIWFNVALDELQNTKSISRYLYHITNDTAVSVPWGHVGGYAFGLAVLAGYDPIVLYGIDLGFGEETHNIMDTEYWNPYYKACVRDRILKKYNLSLEKVTPSNPTEWQKYLDITKKEGHDLTLEYNAKNTNDLEAAERVKKEYFHYYINPYGKNVYHDMIFKAYKDIMMAFIIQSGKTVIQASDYTTLFPTECDLCKGQKTIKQIKKVKKQCYKCKVEREEEEFDKNVECNKCKGTGMMGQNLKCMSIQDLLTSNQAPPIVLKQ